MVGSTHRPLRHPSARGFIFEISPADVRIGARNDYRQQGIARELGIGRQTIGLYNFALGHDETGNALLKCLRAAVLWNTITTHSHIRR